MSTKKENPPASPAGAPVVMTEEEKALREILRTDTLMPGNSSPKTEFLRWWFSGKDTKFKTRVPNVLAMVGMMRLAHVARTQVPQDFQGFNLATFLDGFNQDFIDLAISYKGLEREECMEMVKGMAEIEEDPMKVRLGSAIMRHS